MNLTELVELWIKDNLFQGPVTEQHKALWDVRNHCGLIVFRFVTRARGRAFIKWAREQGYSKKMTLEKTPIRRTTRLGSWKRK